MNFHNKLVLNYAMHRFDSSFKSYQLQSFYQKVHYRLLLKWVASIHPRHEIYMLVAEDTANNPYFIFMHKNIVCS